MNLLALVLLGLVAAVLAQDVAQEEYPSSYEVAQAQDQAIRQKRGIQGVLIDDWHGGGGDDDDYGGGGGGGHGWHKKKKKSKARIAIPIKKVIKVRKVKKGWEDDWEDGWKEPEYIKFAIPKIHIPLKLVKKKSHGWH